MTRPEFGYTHKFREHSELLPSASVACTLKYITERAGVEVYIAARVRRERFGPD
jgi:hypothetical protein